MRINLIPALVILFALMPLLISIYIFILFVTFHNPIYYSKRIGISGKIFFMPKFRTMKIETPQLATHLLYNSNNYLYFYGNILRKFSLDEIPQIFSVLLVLLPSLYILLPIYICVPIKPKFNKPNF